MVPSSILASRSVVLLRSKILRTKETTPFRDNEKRFLCREQQLHIYLKDIQFLFIGTIVNGCLASTRRISRLINSLNISARARLV